MLWDILLPTKKSLRPPTPQTEYVPLLNMMKEACWEDIAWAWQVVMLTAVVVSVLYVQPGKRFKLKPPLLSKLTI